MIDEEYLIHFTSMKTDNKKYKNDDDRDEKGFDYLLGIIKNGFMFASNPTYTPKKKNNKTGTELRIEMVCFAELSLSDIVKEKDRFGNFGICMKREWMETYSGQPVLYSSPSSVNNSILLLMDDLIYTSYRVFQGIKDDRINQLSLDMAYLSILFQGITEPISHKKEKEVRIIYNPRNKVLDKDVFSKPKQEEVNSAIVYSSSPFLPISSGDDAEYFIIPKRYRAKFCDRVINRKSNEKKIRFIEDIKS